MNLIGHFLAEPNGKSLSTSLLLEITNLYTIPTSPDRGHDQLMRGEAGSTGPATWLESRMTDYCCVSAEASFSACFAADLLSVVLIVGLSV